MLSTQSEVPREFLAIKNRYVMKNLIGKGLFGELYSAKDLEGEHSNIALKVSSDVESFTLEMRVMFETYQNGGKTP